MMRLKKMKGTLSMRKITEILRLQAQGLKQRQIARSLNISLGVVHKYLILAEAAGVNWPLDQGITDAQLKTRLFKSQQPCKPESYTAPDCEQIHKELKHKGVTLKLLHEDYKLLYPATHYQYSQFCFIYQTWKKKQHLSLRQIHKSGDQLFVDYAGPTIAITVSVRLYP